MENNQLTDKYFTQPLCVLSSLRGVFVWARAYSHPGLWPPPLAGDIGLGWAPVCGGGVVASSDFPSAAERAQPGIAAVCAEAQRRGIRADSPARLLELVR